VAYSDLRPTYLATAPDVEIRYNYKNAAIIASNQSNEHWTRFFGTTAKNPICSYTTDISAVTDNFNVTRACVLRASSILAAVSPQSAVRTIRSLKDESAELNSAKGSADNRAIIGRIQVDIDLPPEEEQEFTFVIGFSMAGDADAIRKFELLENYENAYEQTLQHFVNECSYSVVTTPDQVINRGVQWPKLIWLA